MSRHRSPSGWSVLRRRGSRALGPACAGLLACAGLPLSATPTEDPSASALVELVAPSSPSPVEQNPANTPPTGTDWTPPGAPALGTTPGAVPGGDGAASLPTIEAQGVSGDGGNTDTTETDDAALAKLAPRVELAGPGTPKWKIIYYISERTTVDDNIFISPSNRKKDLYFTLSPGFAAGWGDFRKALLANNNRFSDEVGQTRDTLIDPDAENYAYLNYTLNATAFVSNSSQDSLDHDLSLASQWTFTKLLVGAVARFQTLSGPDVDVGTRTKRELFSLAVNTRYTISDKTSVEVNLNGVDRLYRTELNSSEISNQDWLDYQLFPKTNVGIGGAIGIRKSQSQPDQDYEQALIRGTYAATDRFILRFNGGLEFDQADNTSRVNPVFDLGVTYVIDEDNSFSLDASRQTSSSAVSTGESVDTTGVNLEFRHRIYGTWSVALAASYDNSSYSATGGSTSVLRSDDYIYIRPSIVYGFAHYSQLELAYEFHHDISSQQEFSFSENLASLQLNIVF